MKAGTAAPPPVFRFALGLELLFLVLLFACTLAGGFTFDQLKTLALVLLPAKAFYVAVFVFFLMKGDAAGAVWQPSFTGNLNRGILGHGIAALVLLVLVALGGVLRFSFFLGASLILETLFILFFTMTLPTLFGSAGQPDFWNNQLVMGAEMPAPPAPPAGATAAEKAVFFLKTGQTAQVFPMLEAHFNPDTNPEEYQTVLLLSGEFAALEADMQRGQITVNDARVQLNRIRHAALTLAAQL